MQGRGHRRGGEVSPAADPLRTEGLGVISRISDRRAAGPMSSAPRGPGSIARGGNRLWDRDRVAHKGIISPGTGRHVSQPHVLRIAYVPQNVR